MPLLAGCDAINEAPITRKILSMGEEMNRASQRALGAFPAVDPRGTEEHDGILDLLLLEAPEWLEVFGQKAKRPRFVALEKLGMHVRQRLLRHKRHFTTGENWVIWSSGHLIGKSNNQ